MNSLYFYASVGGATRHTVVVVCVCHYASVGGATRHTVIALSVILSFCLSVTPFLRRTLNGELSNLQCRYNSTLSRLCISESSMQSFVLELWRGLLTLFTVAGNQDFSKGKAAHS